MSMRGALTGPIVATVVALTLVGCGTSSGPGSAEEPSAAPSIRSGAAPSLTQLAQRPVLLPRLKLAGSFTDDVPGECFSGEDTAAGAIHLHGVPGEGSLGPPTHVRAASAYATITEGTPRITYWSSMASVAGSKSRAGESFWISRDAYRGPLLVRGGRIDRPGDLGFGRSRLPEDELLLPQGNGKSWRALADSLPTGWRAAKVPIRVAAPGCYAIQMDGDGFSNVITFAVAAG